MARRMATGRLGDTARSTSSGIASSSMTAVAPPTPPTAAADTAGVPDAEDLFAWSLPGRATLLAFRLPGCAMPLLDKRCGGRRASAEPASPSANMDAAVGVPDSMTPRLVLTSRMKL